MGRALRRDLSHLFRGISVSLLAGVAEAWLAGSSPAVIAPSVQSTESVSYTHLDVYKRQQVRNRDHESLAGHRHALRLPPAQAAEARRRGAGERREKRPSASGPDPNLCRMGADLDHAAARDRVDGYNPVSYTHLDVYKRQGIKRE